jgi:hypothetical protein
VTPDQAADMLELERLRLAPRRKPMPVQVVEDDDVTKARRRRVLAEIPIGYQRKAAS